MFTIFLVSMAWFALGVSDDHFVDEYAYITQAYQADLILEGRRDDPSWLSFVGYDLVPLPKYLINGALRIAMIPRASPEAAVRWYRNSHLTWGPPVALTAARVPSILLGAVGCVAIFAIGTMIGDARVGGIASLFLAISPLYRLHAHRAMSEVPCESFLLVTLALGLGGAHAILRQGMSLGAASAFVMAGIAAGLSVLAKFNGLLSLMTLGAWSVLTLALPGISRSRKLGLACGVCLIALLAWQVFVGLNPFMTARPRGPLPQEIGDRAAMGTWDRFMFLIHHRQELARGQQAAFSHNALTTCGERAKVVAIQGFGRFGLFGPSKSVSTVRYDWIQDWGVLPWLPLVAGGLVVALVKGGRQVRVGEIPVAWALVVWAGITLSVVTAYLPMAWDRYLLPIQAPASLLAALAVGVAWDSLAVRSHRGGAGS